jgi:hypothetical protein
MAAQAVGRVMKGECDRVGAIAKYCAKPVEDDEDGVETDEEEEEEENGGARQRRHKTTTSAASGQRDALQAVVVIAPTPVRPLLLAISRIAIASVATTTSGPFNARPAQSRAPARAQARIRQKKHALISCCYQGP